MGRLKIEVISASRGAQSIVPLELDEGATAIDALRASGLPESRSAEPLLGIFGQRVAPGTRLKDGDRLEVYRPLAIDPKEARRAKVSARRRLKR